VRRSAPPPRSPSAGPAGASRSRAAMVRSACSENKLSGTIGSWIGSMAKLAYL
jgi:hypothetical protein